MVLAKIATKASQDHRCRPRWFDMACGHQDAVQVRRTAWYRNNRWAPRPRCVPVSGSSSSCRDGRRCGVGRRAIRCGAFAYRDRKVANSRPTVPASQEVSFDAGGRGGDSDLRVGGSVGARVLLHLRVDPMGLLGDESH